jgi:hypothetical protein
MKHYKEFVKEEKDVTTLQRQDILKKLREMDRFSSLASLFKLYNKVTKEKLARVLGMD